MVKSNNKQCVTALREIAAGKVKPIRPVPDIIHDFINKNKYPTMHSKQKKFTSQSTAFHPQ